MHSNYPLIISLVLSGISIIIAVYAFFQAKNLRAWRKNFGPAEHPENLEEIITSIVGKIKALETGQAVARAYSEQLEETLSHAVQKVGLIRFDSQADEGGNLSFSLAILDDHLTGIVITSLYGRTSNRVYSKRINQGNSESNLSDEERDAMFQAISSRSEQKQKSVRNVKH